MLVIRRLLTRLSLTPLLWGERAVEKYMKEAVNLLCRELEIERKRTFFKSLLHCP
jgi:hypothetical protein